MASRLHWSGRLRPAVVELLLALDLGQALRLAPEQHLACQPEAVVLGAR